MRLKSELYAKQQDETIDNIYAVANGKTIVIYFKLGWKTVLPIKTIDIIYSSAILVYVV